MINIYEVNETNAMIDKENLDVRTITMGISLLVHVRLDLEYEGGEMVVRRFDRHAIGKAREQIGRAHV